MAVDIGSLIKMVLEQNEKQTERLDTIADRVSDLVGKVNLYDQNIARFYERDWVELVDRVEKIELKVLELEKEAVKLKVYWGIGAFLFSALAAFLVERFSH